MPTGWRITKTRFAAQAFDGEGARLYGGRWNSTGVRMVYTAQSISLAVLEVLVHLQNTPVLSAYSLIAVEFDERYLKRLDRSILPSNWSESPSPPELLGIGDAWIASGESVVLEVPSAVIESESLYLLNPEHADFSKVRKKAALPFSFDPRLIG